MSIIFPKGVLSGKDVQNVFKHAKKNNYALPAVNVIGNNSINTVLETASELKENFIEEEKQLTAAIRVGLRNKVKDHNYKYGDKPGK